MAKRLILHPVRAHQAITKVHAGMVRMNRASMQKLPLLLGIQRTGRSSVV